MEVCVGRKAIFDRRRDLVGYEVLFGSSDQEVQGDSITTTLQGLGSAVATIGIEKLLNGRVGYFQFDRSLLVSEWATFLPPDQAVLELVNLGNVDQEVIDACRSLRNLGYSLALDWQKTHACDHLINEVNILCINLKEHSEAEQQKLIAQHSSKGKKIVARNVNEPADFTWAAKANYDLFQGNFFARPNVIRTSAIPSSQLTNLKLFRESRKPDLNFLAIETLLRQDVASSYALLRYINSAAFFWKARIDSVRQALVLLGENELRKWLYIATLPMLAPKKPKELINHALLRARFCELVGNAAGIYSEGADPFLLGMLSLLDAILDCPMESVLSDLSLAKDLEDALLERPTNSASARLLHLVKSYEGGFWQAVNQEARTFEVTVDQLNRLYFSAIDWAHEVTSHQN